MGTTKDPQLEDVIVEVLDAGGYFENTASAARTSRQVSDEKKRLNDLLRVLTKAKEEGVF